MATPYHSQCGPFKRYRLFHCTFLTKCIQIRNISPFLIRPSVRTGAPSPRGKVLRSGIPANSNLPSYFRKPGSIIFQNHPRRGYHISYLISYISYLHGAMRLRRRATARVAPTRSAAIDDHFSAQTQKPPCLRRAASSKLKRDINRTFSCSYGQLQTSAYASGWG